MQTYYPPQQLGNAKKRALEIDRRRQQKIDAANWAYDHPTVRPASVASPARNSTNVLAAIMKAAIVKYVERGFVREKANPMAALRRAGWEYSDDYNKVALFDEANRFVGELTFAPTQIGDTLCVKRQNAEIIVGRESVLIARSFGRRWAMLNGHAHKRLLAIGWTQTEGHLNLVLVVDKDERVIGKWVKTRETTEAENG